MQINNRFLKLIKICISVIIILSVFAVNVFASSPATTAETPFETYTYWQGLGAKSKSKVFVKPMYDVKKVIEPKSVGINTFKSLNDITTSDGYTYILDSTDSVIYILDKDYKFSKKIDNIMYKSKKLNIDGASGIFVKNNLIYIADTKNARILVMDLEGNVKHYLTLPKSKLIPDDFKYNPIKVAVDSRDYLYIASDGSFYGALVYSPKMEFLGFYGANNVASSVTAAIKKFIMDIFSTDAKRAASVRSLPYQFTDFAIGPNDFVYTVTSTSENETSVGQVKRLNPGGKDVLKKDDFNFADIADRLLKPESLKSIAVDDDGFFYLLDSGNYNRIFWYDRESNIMCVFGGGSSAQNQKGTFAMGGAISVNGTDVLVCDPVSKNITVFSITEYGKLVRNTQLRTLNDDFENISDNWNKVIKEDVNNQLAYKGIAKAYYTAGDYAGALKYSKMGADRETYSDAFVKTRTAFLEKNFTLVFIGVVLIVALITAGLIYKKKKAIVLVKNEKAKIMLNSVFHPFDSFGLVKSKNMGSVSLAGFLLLLFYLINAISDTATGYAFNRFDASSYNSVFVLLRTVALVLLFVVSNWLVCVLLGGIGKLKEIFIVTCYSLIPMIFATLISICFSHILTPDEFVFISIFSTVCEAYTFIILAVGIMKIHDYEFGKFLGTTVITIITMLIVIFLIFLVFMLAQQVYGWVGTIFTEIKYR